MAAERVASVSQTCPACGASIDPTDAKPLARIVCPNCGEKARVAASVNHPNVIQIFSSGTDRGRWYLVMELVDHESLDDFIKQRKRLSEQQVLDQIELLGTPAAVSR